MSENQDSVRSRKVTVYSCPSPGCPFVSGGGVEISEHINEEHPGEWDEDYWPEANQWVCDECGEGGDGSVPHCPECGSTQLAPPRNDREVDTDSSHD